jgi:glycosyltransferase involved in cell wall biosynthesis
VVTDASAIQRYYRERYSMQSTMIPYGADTALISSQNALNELHLEAGRYFLYVSRMEPENNALLVRESFEKIDAPEMQLALVGDAPYSEEYIRRVKQTKDPRIVIPGGIYGAAYTELQSHCFAYIHATEVGGTHPALIEAMGRGALVLYLHTTENAEVAEGCGIPFTHETLVDVMRTSVTMSEVERQRLQRAAQERVRQRYSWDAVTIAYEELLTRLCGAG